MHTYRKLFISIVVLLIALMATTFPFLIKHTKMGLEFKGGYEIVYQADPLVIGQPVQHAQLVQAANILAEAANKQGVSEPLVNVVGTNQVRLELAGVKAGDPVIADLQNIKNLPVKLTEKYSETVGGVLGASDLKATLQAGTIALLVIFGFLVLVYRGKGLIAVLTTSVSLWLLLLAFVALNATLSLSAIVAFVLAIGLASDANIIAYERSREEALRGKANNEALAIGSEKSFHTIIDANASVAICAVILLVAGIGPIRGFALTTLLSIIFSFIANVLLAHYLIKLCYSEDQGHQLFWGKFSNANSSAVRKRFDFIGLSSVAIIAGLLFFLVGSYYAVSRPLNLDIEFKPGTALDLQINKPITQEAATQLIAKSGISAATVAIGGKYQDAIAVRFDNVLSTHQVNQVVDEFKKRYGSNVNFAENTADPGAAKSLAQQSISVVLQALLGTALFILLRFNWRIAVASTLSVIGSVLFVMSCFSFFHLEMDITFIAAMLIVIGYALNEAVVVFDRIRERMHKGDSASAEMVNQCINQVVQRSLLTVATVLTGSVSLYFYGAEPLQMFSLSIFLGLVWGTFSSLFIAPRIWLILNKESAKNLQNPEPQPFQL